MQFNIIVQLMFCFCRRPLNRTLVNIDNALRLNSVIVVVVDGMFYGLESFHHLAKSLAKWHRDISKLHRLHRLYQVVDSQVGVVWTLVVARVQYQTSVLGS